MGRPGHPVLNWNQLRKAQAIYVFSGMTWRKALITETYGTSCTVLFSEDSKNHAERVIDLENIRSVLGYEGEEDG